MGFWDALHLLQEETSSMVYILLNKYKDKALEYRLEIHSFRKVSVVGSSLGSMALPVPGSSLGLQCQVRFPS